MHTDERTQVHSARSSQVITHPYTNRDRRALTSVNVPLSYVALVTMDDINLYASQNMMSSHSYSDHHNIAKKIISDFILQQASVILRCRV